MRSGRRLGAFLAVFCAAPAISLADASEPPEALRRAIAARSADLLRTARVEYSVTQRDPDAATQPHTLFYTYQSAGDHYVVTHQGDDEGVYGRGPDGKPVVRPLNRPRQYLVKDDQVWRHVEDALDANVFSSEVGVKGFRCLDLREAGLNPVLVGTNFQEHFRRSGADPLTYSSETVDGLHVVSAVGGPGKLKWWIDPERDWNVVRTEVHLNGEHIGERRFTLQQNPYDGVWFPSRIEHYRLAAGDTRPSTTIRISLAEFNRPEHSLVLTPADIGIEVGTMVTFQDREPGRTGYWDGEKAVSFDELQERIDSGEIAEGPIRARERLRWLTFEARKAGIASGQMLGAGPTSRPTTQPVVTAFLFDTEWEAYTQRFIEVYSLNEDQKQKAWTICDDCQTAARAYVASRKRKLDELDQLIAAARDKSDANLETIRTLQSQREKLLAPVNQIFETRLKPRLERLPTRAQREAVRAASQPTLPNKP